MAYPGTGMEGMYRNNINDVSKFLNFKHAEDYMVCLNKHNNRNRNYIIVSNLLFFFLFTYY